MAVADINIEEIRKTMPWKEMVHPNGLVQMIDKFGREVPMFTMTALVVVVTHKMAIKEPV